MIRTKMFIKYARMHLQEAEAAIQEDVHQLAIQKCKDCALALIKAVKEAYPRKELVMAPPDLKKLKSLLEDLTDSEQTASEIIKTLDGLLKLEPQNEGGLRIKAEEAFQMAGDAFRMIHDLFVPTHTF